MTFIFLEPEEDYNLRKAYDSSTYQKKTQIKIRVEQLNLEDNDSKEIQSWINNFQDRVLLITDLKYKIRNLRCTYVHNGNVSWKTTIFCESKEEANLILSSLCSLIQTIYAPEQLSITIHRESKWDKTPVFVHLYKVVLLVNGHLPLT